MTSRSPRLTLIPPTMGAALMRLFVALVPPAKVVASLPHVPDGVRPVPPDQVHLTLAFLGEQPDAEPVTASLDPVLAVGTAPVLRLASAGRFGTAVWLGVHGDLVRLTTLAASVQRAVGATGVALEDRPWRPHLTIGRSRDPRGRRTGRSAPPLLSLDAYAGPSAPWTEVRLVRSHLGRDGARHEALARWTLTPEN